MSKNHLLRLIIAIALLAGGTASAQCGFSWSQSQPNIIDFVDTSTPPMPGITSYDWNFGDNQSGWGPGPQSHTYSVPGTYYVCLNLSDSFNLFFCAYCDTITVTGTLLCQMNIGFYAQTNATCQACANGAVTCWATNGTAPYSYLWSNGNTTATASGLLPGTYSCCVTDANGCTSCDSITIQVQQSNCNITFWTWVQSAGQVAFNSNIQNTNSNHTITWDYGDQTIGSGQNTWHQYTQSGTYNVCVTLYDSLTWCSDTFCSNVTVNVTNPSCIASFYVQMDSINPNQAWIYNLSTGSPNMTYQWWWGDNTPIDTGAYPTHIYQTNATYQICLIVIDPANSCTDTLCQMIQVMRLSQEAVLAPLYVNVLAPLTSIANQESQHTWTLLPNPVSEQLTITGTFGNNDTYFITDLAGRTVMRGTLQSNSVSVGELPGGVFFFTLVKESGQVESRRFIRE